MAWSRNDNALEHLARFGFGARGLVYCVVGVLALLAALGQGGAAGDSKGALRAVLGGPFGAVVVGLIALVSRDLRSGASSRASPMPTIVAMRPRRWRCGERT